MEAQDIKNIIRHKDMTQGEFAEQIGVSQQVVNGWFKRNSIPSKYIKVIEDVLGINTKLTITDDSVLKIKTITSEVGAGMGVEIDSIDRIEHGTIINIMKDGLEYKDPDCLVAIPVSGTSMLPTIMPNEYVIMDTCVNKYVGDDLYVINFAGNLLVKRLQFDPVSNVIDIMSDNPQYTNYKLNMSEDQTHFHIIGRVVTTIRR